MDASQYKGYVLVLPFIKYVSEKYVGQPHDAPIVIPPGASFRDMVALKGKPDIGDQINKPIIAPLANANRLSAMPDFNDPFKLGSGKEMVERLSKLIALEDLFERFSHFGAPPAKAGPLFLPAAYRPLAQEYRYGSMLGVR
jgi:type I restriction enzyme M protein